MAIIESDESRFYADRPERYLSDFAKRAGVDPTAYCVEPVVKTGGVGIFRLRDIADQPVGGFPTAARHVDAGENPYTGDRAKAIHPLEAWAAARTAGVAHGS